MSIQLDGLPTSKPESTGGNYPIIPEGKVFLKIIDAQVKQKVDGSGAVINQWLNVSYENATGSRMWDNVFITSNPNVQYKLQRFLTACRIPLTGSLELTDLAMLVKGKEIYADIKHKENDYYNPPKTEATVDIFESDIFYAVGEVASASHQDTGSY